MELCRVFMVLPAGRQVRARILVKIDQYNKHGDNKKMRGYPDVFPESVYVL